MVSPTGKHLSLEDISDQDLRKILNPTAKRKTKAVEEVRRLGPGVEIPKAFLQAQEILLKKLIGDNAGDSKSKNAKGIGRENIVGMHIGQKHVRGKATGSLAIIVTVRKKIKDQGKIQAKYRIPKRIKVGKQYVPVDIKLGYDIEPHAIGGQVCQLANVPGGSIGCFCFINLTGGHADFLLTNNHVIGRFANGNPGSGTSQDDVFDSAGGLIAGQRLKCGTLDDAEGFSIDAAMAFTGGRNPEADSKKHVALSFSGNIQTAVAGDLVKMYGAASKGTKGKVRRVLAFKDVPYTAYPINRNIFLRKVFEIEPDAGAPHFSLGGDSGSLIVLESGDPVGILIGGGKDENGRPFSLAQDLATIKADLLFDGIHSVP